MAETTVQRLLCCGFRRIAKAMGQVYQWWWRICREINVFPRFKYHMFYVLFPFVTYLLTLIRIYRVHYLTCGDDTGDQSNHGIPNIAVFISIQSLFDSVNKPNTDTFSILLHAVKQAAWYMFELCSSCAHNFCLHVSRLMKSVKVWCTPSRCLISRKFNDYWKSLLNILSRVYVW
jgi:hypothetical protein